ncbi:MAG: NeuD/PglB/VioB family sugar acetyltransferase [Actinomycetota bacterium]
MEEIILIGASGLAREVIGTLSGSNFQRVIGVLDDDPNAVGSRCGGMPVLGSSLDLERFPRARVLVCVGSGAARERIVARLCLPPECYATVVDASVRNPAGCPVGAGSIILAHVTITADAIVGRHVVMMPAVTVTHDDRVDDFVTLAAGVSLGGGVSVERGAYLGMNSCVRQGITIGEYSTLGMGAVLLRALPKGEIWAGVPARRLERQQASRLVDSSVEASR